MLILEQEARELVKKISAMPGVHPSHYAQLKATLERMAAERSTYAKEIATAQEDCNCDDIQVDDDPVLSVADTGVWVGAWVGVPIDDEQEKT